ncbi:VOC family protein [Burkholderia sp. Ac-20379]|uniref:VOC family protein n=1 Tax=Burkholderia sp. Ac-20379 TaxID=2703900 RepID=UPI00197D7816|nr:VOC family protein [Burkholderia sp. Ac-20379]MBN3727975.1 VOC family protein [Burkholderia sp. Ac-20379]
MTTAAATPASTTAAAPLTHRPITWFEIPTVDLDRATRFYEAMLDTRLRRENFGGSPMSVFDGADATSGALVQDPHGSKPAKAGPVVYLGAGESVTGAIERARRAGGAVDGPVHELPRGIGYIAYVFDTEGNRVGLHASAR